MNKKSLYLILLSLILFAIIVNTGSTYLWGYHTIASSDEIRNYDRAIQIALHRVPINRIWFQPNVYELYPGGLHIMLSSFMMMSGDFNVFDISFIFKILFAIIPTFLAFLLGLKINRSVAILSAFFYITSFLVFTNSKNHYIYIFTYSNYVATGSITIIMLFISLLSFLMAVSKRSRYTVAVMSSIYVLSSLAHGTSHISTFMGQLFNFSALFIFLIIYGYLKNKEHIKNLAALFLFLTFLSGFFVFLVYYYPMYHTIIGPDYKIAHLLPKFLSWQFIYNIPLLFLIIIIASIVLYISLLKVHTKLIFLGNKRRWISLIVGIYLLLYIYILVVVTKNPHDYIYTFVLIFSPFPTYIPHHLISKVPLYSLLAGFLVYILSVFGILYVFRKFEKERLIGYVYIVFFLMWFVFGFIIMYYVSRIIYIQYFLPFILAIGAYYFLKRKSKAIKHISWRRFLRLSFVILLVVILISVPVVSFINKDPNIRDESTISNPLRIGTSLPPWATYDFIVYANYHIDSSHYILGNSYSLETLSATTLGKPPTISWVTYYKNHTLWAITVVAIRNPSKYTLERFYDTYYPTKYMFVEYREHYYWGPAMPVERYDNSPYLLKIYQSNGGQRMYLIVF